jgi:hypothetical protein
VLGALLVNSLKISFLAVKCIAMAIRVSSY